MLRSWSKYELAKCTRTSHRQRGHKEGVHAHMMTPNIEGVRSAFSMENLVVFVVGKYSFYAAHLESRGKSVVFRTRTPHESGEVCTD